MKNANLYLVPKIDEEAFSVFGCNIASGIIAESIAAMKDTNPKSKEAKPEKIYLNGYTLFRNLVDCLEGNTEFKVKLLKADIGRLNTIELFVKDTELLLNGLVNAKVEPVIYIPSYLELSKKWPLWKDPENLSTIKYYIYKAWKPATDKLAATFPDVVIRTTHKLPKYNDIYIVTHLSQDLLNYVNTRNTLLVESHTGDIKDKTRWYTKYHKFGKKDMSVFPFNEFLLRLLGDNWFLGHETVQFRKWLYNIALKYNWNPYTTEEQVIRNIRQKDPIMGKKLKSIYTKIYK